MQQYKSTLLVTSFNKYENQLHKNTVIPLSLPHQFTCTNTMK